MLEHRRLLAVSVRLPLTVPTEQTTATLINLHGNPGAFTSVTGIGVATPRAPIAFTRGNYTLNGAGIGIGGSGDQFTFASRPADGDGSIIARVASLTPTGGTPRAGVMIRSSPTGSAAFVGVFVVAGGGVSFIRRPVDGGASSQTFIPNATLPRFVKLTREGDAVTGYHSADGLSWTQIGASVTASLGNVPSVGLAATAGSTTQTTTAIFSHVSLILPLGSDASDLGSASVGGYANYLAATNRYTIAGAGLDNGDAIGFTHRVMLGSGAILATIDRFIASTPTSGAGLAIRSALGAGAPFASVHFLPSGAVRFQWRSTSGGSISSATEAGLASPLSLKLERDGDAVRAFRSSDRVHWTQIGPAASIDFASAKALAGVSIFSGSTDSLATAQLSGVTQLSMPGSTVDVGQAASAGSLLFDAVTSTHRMIGRGTGVAGGADQLTLAAVPMNADGDVAAYLSGFAPQNASARAGLAIRASADFNAPFVGLFLATSGLVVQWRGSSGGAISNSHIPGIVGPVSLRLTRVGNVVTARYSVDGTSWMAAGSGKTAALGSSPVAGMALASGSATALATADFTGFDIAAKLPTGAGLFGPSDEAFLTDLQARSVQFFYEETNPNTGLVPDGSLASGGSPSAVSSIAAVGFGLSALTIADARGFLTHDQAYTRALTTVNFLYNNGAHVNGFFYHFLNPTTGARDGNTELSPIDTALLMAGVIEAGQHWAGTPLATVATSLFDRVNWPWMLKPNGNFYGHWTPEGGFEYGYGDFSEAVLLYLLGLGSQTHPISTASWNSWLRSPAISYAGSTFVTAQTRALFTVQYPMGWFDLRGKVDSFGLNYFENAQKATLAQRTMAINMAGTYPHWGPNVWGLTAADGPSGYTVWGGPPPTPNVDGSVVPTAPGGSLAFTPRHSVDALRHIQQNYASTYRKYGFVDAFNPHTNWTSPIVLGIDVGMMLLAAENARTGSVWERFMQSPVAQSALTRAFGSAVMEGDVQLLPSRPSTPARARVFLEALYSTHDVL